MVFISKFHLLVPATCVNFWLPGLLIRPFWVFVRWPRRPVLSAHPRVCVCVEHTGHLPAEPRGRGPLADSWFSFLVASLLFSVMGPAPLSTSMGVRCPRGRPPLNVPPPLSGSDPLSLLRAPHLSTLLSRSVCRESVCEVGCQNFRIFQRAWIVWAWCRLAGEKSGSRRPQQV